MKILIDKMGINGEGIGYYQKKPIFIEGALPTEEVMIQRPESHKTYFKAKLERVHHKSKDRVQPACRIAHRCKVCSIMHLQYEKQLKAKTDILKQTLSKYAGIDGKCVQPMIANASPIGYRNQCKLPLHMEDGVLCSGMYLPGSNYFLAVEHCVIHEPLLEAVRKKVMKVLNQHHMTAYDYHQKKGVRSLVIRVFQNQAQVTIVSGNDELSKALIADLLAIDEVVSLWQSIHTVKKTVDIFGKKMIFLGGEKQLKFMFGGYRMQISPRSFFQLNTNQANVLYETVASLMKQKHYGTVVEAYSGIGAISLFLSAYADEVIGVESISDAVSNANAIAKANQLSNLHFICADAAEECAYLSKKKQIDLLVVDPPRTGLSMEMLSVLLQSKIEEVIYISCNPATLAKNLAVLKQRYIVDTIIPIDLFSQTANIETIVHLKRKKKRS